MPVPPSHITAQSLKSAKGEVLKSWIIAANEAAGVTNYKSKTYLSRTGTINELRAKLAEHYNIDLDVPPPDAAQPSSDLTEGPESAVNQKVRDRQWEHLIELAERWRIEGDSFRLIKPVPISTATAPPASSFAALPVVQAPSHYVPAHLPTPFSPTTWLSLSPAAAPLSLPSLSLPLSHSIRSQSFIGHSPAPTPSTSMQHLPPTPASTFVPLQSASASILESCSQSVEALDHIDDLRHAIDLSKNGTVEAYRKLYGNEEKRHRALNHEIWKQKRAKVNRLERVYKVYTDEFGSDDDRFFAFFTLSSPTSHQRSAAKRARTNAQTVYISVNKLATAAGRCYKDISEEKQKRQYTNDDSSFSLEKWHAQWSDKNTWEVWRVLGLERY
ncbi:uncharacterized protein PHACADRAFT_109426 [Phanerochaete carnosa HHB-10118-sp]|uniref:Uncharacterized protein n=1 Tax=Phanerochaete carnosa (strain HHB-10118-sp) TaxID=650164 RepID=K5VNA5_PHACS|nr:uncharacterized protein PHACADRAFT_109426 [Phanerochaete carnosa HHB-10118-sp]EKM48079.1 hypothetical protein PHACADRAFT_109426 [Phanerochaete carnosa HHB-10118-sp]